MVLPSKTDLGGFYKWGGKAASLGVWSQQKSAVFSAEIVLSKIVSYNLWSQFLHLLNKAYEEINSKIPFNEEIWSSYDTIPNYTDV